MSLWLWSNWRWWYISTCSCGTCMWFCIACRYALSMCCAHNNFSMRNVCSFWITVLLTLGPFCSSCCQAWTLKTLVHLAVCQRQLMDEHLQLNLHVYLITKENVLLCILTAEGWEKTFGNKHTRTFTVSVLLVKRSQRNNSTLWMWCACTVYVS